MSADSTHRSRTRPGRMTRAVHGSARGARSGRHPARARPRRRGELLRLRAARTGWSRSPPTTASTRPRRTSADRRLPARRLRRPGDRQRPAVRRARGRHRRRRSTSSLGSGLAVVVRRRTRRAARGRSGQSEMGARPHAPALRPRPLRRAPAAAAVQARRAGRASSSSWSPPRATAFWAFGAVRRCCSRPSRRSPGCRSASSLRRLVIEMPFVVFAVLLPFVAHGRARRRARPVAVRVRAVGAPGTSGQGHPRRASRRILLAATTDPRDLLRGPASGCDCPPMLVADRVVHGPLPRRGRRRDAPDADRPGVARLHAPRSAAVAACSPGPRARCSSAPTSAASGSTWRCCPAATPGAMPASRRQARPRRAVGGGPAVLPLCRADRCALGWMVDRVTLRRPAGRAAWPTPTPTATRRCSASTSPSPRGERVALLGPERRRQDHARAAPQRHPRPLAPGSVEVGGLPVGKATPGARSAGGSASSSRTRTTSCSCRRCARTWPSARRTSGCAAPSWTRGSTRRSTRVGMQEHRRPAAAPPVVRPAPAGGGGDRARDASPEILVLDEPSSQPRPGGPAGARRDPARRST